MNKRANREPGRGRGESTIQRLLRSASRGGARIDFLTEISQTVLERSRADALKLRLNGPELAFVWDFASTPQPVSQFTVIEGGGSKRDGAKPGPLARFPSCASFPFVVDDRTSGSLELKSPCEGFFSAARLERCEIIARSLGIAIANHQAQWALRERVKELTCLYELGRIAQLRGIPLDEILRRTVELLPPAWQFPEIACARIVLDGADYSTPGFREGHHRQAADLLVQGGLRGSIEVVYTEKRPEFAEGAFLPEERSLLDTIARELALIVERRQSEEEQAKLQAQLRHADRLATIGQLAAGVAHELSEPLANILGFAQLIQKSRGLEKETASDIDKIVRASLHAREIIHKLLVFSRQKPPVKTQVNLNRLVREGLYFLESRCAHAGIQVCPRLASEMPDLDADGSQLHQALVNLVVNGIQAMPDGGTLVIETRAAEDFVSLMVSDSGCGMTEEVKERLFTPFFTTKDVDQGTGLGLAVVHGIVTAHRGVILVESAPGQGARFEIRLPRDRKTDREQPSSHA